MDLLQMSLSDAAALCKSSGQEIHFPSHLDAQGHNSHPSKPSTHPGHRMAKKRASRACHYCRVKKIKCSVVKSGSPCNTCQLDEVDCLVSMTRRKRRPRIAGVLVDPSSPPSQNSRQRRTLIEPSSTLDEVLALQNSICLIQDIQLPHSVGPAQGIPTSQATSNKPATVQPSMYIQVPPLQYSDIPHRQLDQPLGAFHTPEYILPMSSSMTADDLAILAAKGVFRLPEILLQTELLRRYAEYVHPLLPVIDLRELLQALESNDGHTQVSLTLFYAVMFAAASYAEIHLLHAEGFTDRKAARKTFFQRAKILYEIDYDTERTSLVQALLLMTYWYETPDDQKDPSYWMGESLSFAYTIGLHQQNDNGHFDIRKQRLRRRMWWCIYMRDQLITLSMRKPNRIKAEHDVPMLVLDDFDIEPLDEDTVHLLGNCTSISDVATRTTLAKVCIEKVKLCICIHNILATQYSESIVSKARESTTPELLVMLTPKQNTAGNMEVIYCEQQLDEWNEDLPQDFYFDDHKAKGAGIEDLEVLSVHRAVLNMLYLTASSALHRPQVVSARPFRRNTPSNLQHLSLKRAKEAAIGITEIAKSLQDSGSTRYLPPVGVTVLVPAMMMHLMEIKAEPSRENPSLRHFRQCVQILQVLQDSFASADYAYLFVDAAVKKSNIESVQGTERRRVRGIADLMRLQGPPTPHAGANSYYYQPIIGIEGPSPSSTPVLPRSDNAIDSAGPAIMQTIDDTSFLESIRGTNDEFEAFIDLDAFSDPSSAGAGLAVDLNGFFTSF